MVAAAPRPAAAAGPAIEVPANEPPPATPAGLFAGIDGGEDGLLLVDSNGLRLGGRLAAPTAIEEGDRVAAQLAGVSREAARATRLLGLGALALRSRSSRRTATCSWRAPTADTVLLAAAKPSLPMARVGLLAERAARAARHWLEAQAMNATQDALDRVTRVPGVRGALVVAAADGLVVAEQLMDGVDGQAVAALAGSLIGRLGPHRRARGDAARRRSSSSAARTAASWRRPVRTTWCWWPWSVRMPTSAWRGSR